MTADPSYDWIRTRLRELGAGTLSPDDKARLEQIAQADPFVADALEGYAAVPTADHAAHLDHIASRIRQPRRARRRWLIPNLTVTAIAAVFMILVGTWAVVRWSGRPTEESRVVILSNDTLQTADAESPTAGVPDSAGHEQPAIAQSIPEQPSAMKRPAPQVEQSKPKTPASAESARSAPVIAVPAQEKDDAAARSLVRPAQSYDLRFFMKDSLGRSVPAEYSIFLVPTTQRIRPDPTGRAIALVSDIGTAPYLIVDYGPHGQRAYAAYAGNSMWPMPFPPLLPGEDDRETAIDLPSPVTGYPALVDALQRNTRFPFENNLKHSTYRVSLAFQIDRQGRPGQVSASPTDAPAEYIEEAKRLLLEGPDWRCPDAASTCAGRFTFIFRKPAR